MANRRRVVQWVGASAAVACFAIRAQSSARAARLLLIHGRGQQGRDPDELKSEWLGALQRGAVATGQSLPREIEVAFPFYGDVLGRFADEFNIPLVSDVQARGSPLDDEFMAFQSEFADSLRKRAGITDAQVNAEYGDNPAPRGPLNWEWVQAILRAIDKNSPGMGQKSLEAFTRDVFLYVTRAGVRDVIDGLVAKSLNEQPTVMVAHSLGTVVAYSVLRTDRRALRVPLLVTLGSPLAVRSVRDAFRPIGFPAPISRWYNAFDTRDVVSLYPLDAENFPVQPPVENNNAVRNSTDNRHGIAGYLDDGEVARCILNALTA